MYHEVKKFSQLTVTKPGFLILKSCQWLSEISGANGGQIMTDVPADIMYGQAVHIRIYSSPFQIKVLTPLGFSVDKDSLVRLCLPLPQFT